MTTRIYLVRHLSPNGRGILVRASNQAQALRYVASTDYTVSVAKQEELVEAIQEGAVVEDASDPEPESEGERLSRESMERAHGAMQA